jgi:PEP-CTERM motif
LLTTMPPAVSPIQGFGGSLGLDFTVNSAITVDQLGAFDNGLIANLSGADGHSGVTVQIYNITSTPVAMDPSVTFTPTNAGTQINGDAFLSVSPFTLGPGRYSVVAVNDDNYNSLGAVNTTSTENTGGGLITFSGSARYTVSLSAFPSQPDGGPNNRYDAGTFDFAAATTPEPSTFVLFGLGGALAFFARRRRTLRLGFRRA